MTVGQRPWLDAEAFFEVKRRRTSNTRFPAAPPPTRSGSLQEVQAKPPTVYSLPALEVGPSTFGPELLARDREWGLDETMYLDSQAETASEQGTTAASAEDTEENLKNMSASAGQSKESVTSLIRPIFREEFDLPGLGMPFGESIDDFFARANGQGKAVSCEEIRQRFPKTQGGEEYQAAPRKDSTRFLSQGISVVKTQGRKRRILAWLGWDSNQGNDRRRGSSPGRSQQASAWWQPTRK